MEEEFAAMGSAPNCKEKLEQVPLKNPFQNFHPGSQKSVLEPGGSKWPTLVLGGHWFGPKCRKKTEANSFLKSF